MKELRREIADCMTGREIHDWWEHLVVPESREVLNKNKNHNHAYDHGVFHSKGRTSQLESSQWPWLGQFEQQNILILDYNPKYKVNIHEYI